MSDLKTYLKLHKFSQGNVQGVFRDTYDVSYCDYELSKQINKQGEADSVLMAGNIKLAIPSLPHEQLMKWMFDVRQIENGEITTHNVNSEVVEKIYFEDARLVGFRFHYESIGVHSATTIITVNAQRISMGDNEFKNYWI